MAFISLPFLLFVAAVTLVYFLVPGRFQWVVLLAASYMFFWLNSERLILVLFANTAVTYLIARAIHSVNARSKQYLKDNAGALSGQEKRTLKEKARKKAGRILLLGIVLDLGTLLFLKYFNFFAATANRLLWHFGFKIHGLNLLLPLGISFYTLQAIAYMADVYRGKYEPDRHFGKFMLFMSFFPQIVQGPIARHNQLAHQLYEGHRFDYERMTRGIQLIVWGWMKKTVIADRIAVPTGVIFGGSGQFTGPVVLFGAICYGLQVYADFSGGMDIARGVAQILGIELELNFRQPYFSRSIEEFWRRWHITLGGWMRDYVFYPLSLSKAAGTLSKKARKLLGNAVGKKLPAFLAMFIVYFLVGFWHGANWTYIVYGLWNGVFIASGILLAEVYDKARNACRIDAESFTWRLFQMVRTFLLCSVGRIFSRAPQLETAMGMFRAMFKNWRDLSFLVDGTLVELGLDSANWILLAMAVAVLFAVDYLHEKDVRIREAIGRQNIIFRWIIYWSAILILLVFGIYGPAYSAAGFIYEQF